LMSDGSQITRHAGLRTDDGVSQVVAAEHVAASIVMFTLIYLLLGAVWIFVLNRKIQHGPDASEERFRKTSTKMSFIGIAAEDQRMAEAGISVTKGGSAGEASS